MECLYLCLGEDGTYRVPTHNGFGFQQLLPPEGTILMLFNPFTGIELIDSANFLARIYKKIKQLVSESP